jgi:hypothetical protein
MTITSRIPESSFLAKEFRDGKRLEKIAVSVDMLSTGYNCRDLLNIGLMRPIFSPTEYIQVKGRGTRLYTFKIGNTTYEKKCFFMLDFCAVSEYFNDKYDYSAPLPIPVTGGGGKGGGKGPGGGGGGGIISDPPPGGLGIVPVWEGKDEIVKREVVEVGPDGEKVDIMTFRGSYEHDLKDFTAKTPEFKAAVEEEDDDRIEVLMNERFYHKPKMYYSPDKLIITYGVPATTAAFVYNALGRKPLPTKDALVNDTIDSISARYNLRYNEQKWLDATVQLLAEDPDALKRFMAGDMTIFAASQFNQLGGLAQLVQFERREEAFEALRQSGLVRQALLTVRQ